MKVKNRPCLFLGRDPKIKNRSRSRKKFLSQPVIDLEIFRKIYQDKQPDEGNIKFSNGSRPKNFTWSFNSGRDRVWLSIGFFLSHYPENILGRDIDRIEVPNTTVYNKA